MCLCSLTARVWAWVGLGVGLGGLVAPVGLDSLPLACGLCGKRQRQTVDGISDFICKRCLGEVFPFNHTTNNREYREAIHVSLKGHLEKAKKLRFNPLDEELKQTLAGYMSQFCKFKKEFFFK